MNDPRSLQRELASFREIWEGGYLEGDPLDPVGFSSFQEFGYISVLYAVYLHCIRPYVTRQTTVLEIGPGRGAWTRTMLGAREVWCLDAKTREENRIDDWLGHPRNLVYHQVTDFECRELPDDLFDFLFSFGALCHVSPNGIESYARNLFPKLRRGANAFWMIADYDQANRLREQPFRFDVLRRVRAGKRLRALRALDRRIAEAVGRQTVFWEALGERGQARLETVLGARLARRPRYRDKHEDLEPRPGRWFHAGVQRTADMLEEVGYEVVSRDIGLVPRDPVLHFRRP